MTAPQDDGSEHPVIPWLNPARRRWLYGVAIAAQPLAIAAGVVTDSVAPLVVSFVLALIAPGVAIKNIQD